MGTVATTYAVQLGFTPAAQAIPDPDRPPLRRALPRAATPYGDEGIEVHRCAAIDWSVDASVHPDLFTFGFDRVDLAGHDALQEVCTVIRRAGRVSARSATAVRAALDGAVLAGGAGRRLTVLHVADEGLIMRTAGPNRLAVVASRSKGPNGHGPATSVHGDQDVHGTPLAQLMDGRAPSLFRHDSPDGHNHDSSLMLVNLWIPLQQITQPLVLGDGRSIDRPRHQLRFGLPTESFLDRDDDQAVNDIWTFVHDDGQRWYFRSAMDHREGYVFDTLSTPHGSAVLPGEDVAERCFVALEAGETAIEAGDVDGLGRVVGEVADLEVPAGTTPALGHAIAEMTALLAEAAADPAAVAGPAGSGWVDRARQARRRVVRMSIELRLVVSVDA